MPSRWSTSCWKVPAVSPRLTSSCSLPVAVEVADPDVDVALDLAAQVRDREAALVDRDQLVVERLDHRVDEHRQRDRRLVRVARVVCSTSAIAIRSACADLRRGEPGAVRGALGLDHVVDQRLDLGRGELVAASPRGRARAGPDAPISRISERRHCRRPWLAAIGTRTPRSRGDLERALVAGVGVADHAHARVGGQHPVELLARRARCRRRRRPSRRGSSARSRPRRRRGC